MYLVCIGGCTWITIYICTWVYKYLLTPTLTPTTSRKLKLSIRVRKWEKRTLNMAKLAKVMGLFAICLFVVLLIASQGKSTFISISCPISYLYVFTWFNLLCNAPLLHNMRKIQAIAWALSFLTENLAKLHFFFYLTELIFH